MARVRRPLPALARTAFPTPTDMKASELRDRSEAEIEQIIAEVQKELTDLRFKRAVAGLENPIVLRDKRRDIARLKTVLSQKRAAARDGGATG